MQGAWQGLRPSAGCGVSAGEVARWELGAARVAAFGIPPPAAPLGSGQRLRSEESFQPALQATSALLLGEAARVLAAEPELGGGDDGKGLSSIDLGPL